MTTAKIIADSISPFGKRITTFQLKFHRFILPEFNTHRMFSRNAASSRAIPVKKILDQVMNDPAMPLHWGKNQPGMSASEELDDTDFDIIAVPGPVIPSTRDRAKQEWMKARDSAVMSAANLIEIGLHKQIANRLLEPFSWTHVILTATEFGNFFNLRLGGEGVQPEMKALAQAMWVEYRDHSPKSISYGEWHLPMIREDELHLDLEVRKKLSVARCARVSYLNHDGTNPDIAKDITLHDTLMNNGHMSPFEHQAAPINGESANFVGWKQYRKFIPNENRVVFNPSEDV